MYNPFPMEYNQINFIEGHFNPSAIKTLNNKTFDFWCRALFQRAISTINITLPERWKGTRKDYFLWILFRFGHMAIFKNPRYGYIFNPCALSGYDVFMQPTRAIISNPKIPSLDQSELRIGLDCEILKLTPDFIGAWPEIVYYAEELSNLKSSYDAATIISRQAYILGAKTKAAGEALKKVFDKIGENQTLAIYDQRIANDQSDKESPFQYLELPFDRAIDSIEKLDADIKECLNRFDTEIGIPTVPYQKRERMVVSEAESKIVDSTSRSLVWFNTLKECVEIVNEHFSDQEPIKVELRFDPDKIEKENDSNEQI